MEMEKALQRYDRRVHSTRQWDRAANAAAKGARR